MPNNITNILSRLNIKARIFVSFLSILLISFLFTAFNVFSLTDFHDRFIKFEQVSTDNNLMLKIDKDISEMQRYILVFSQNSNIASISQLNALHKQLETDINTLLNDHIFKQKINQSLLKKMQVSIASFNEKIDNLKTQRDYRDNYIDTQLPSLYKSTNDAITLLSDQIDNTKNKVFLRQLWKIQLNLLKAEAAGYYYFDKHEFKARSRALQYIDEARNLAQTVQHSTTNTEIHEETKNITQLINSTKKTFLQALQADRNYLFLTNIVIAGESAELSILSENLKSESLQRQSDLFKITENNIAINKNIAFYASIFSLFLVLFIALVIGKHVTKPLQSITETFKKLAKGERLAEIPGVSRHDEIGELAKAANVFREANLQTESLLKQAEVITENLRVREHELEKMNNELNNFTHVASHDLKTPIRGIADLVDWVNEDLGAEMPESVKQNLDRIRLRVKRMEALIEDLLQYSYTGKNPAKIKLVEPISMIHEILELHPIPNGFNITITGEVASFETSKTPLQTTIRNLISNALKHHDKTEGNIDINVAAEGGYCIFTIEDDGPGIPLAAQERVFMLFQTLAPHTQTSSGLGLAFAKRLVEANNGRIELESTENKRGTIFRVWWPILGL